MLDEIGENMGRLIGEKQLEWQYSIKQNGNTRGKPVEIRKVENVEERERLSSPFVPFGLHGWWQKMGSFPSTVTAPSAFSLCSLFVFF